MHFWEISRHKNINYLGWLMVAYSKEEKIKYNELDELGHYRIHMFEFICNNFPKVYWQNDENIS